MTISFVSSGPGNPDLLTVLAVKRISDADIIFYDDLSAGEILNLAKKSATLLSVGKRAGLASPKQNQVSRLLVEYGRTGKKIVRLKSGDSSIFSRLEEEITALNENELEFEIIPGVSSAMAAAAAAKIPLTRRVMSRRVQFITGHDFNGKLPDDLNIASLILTPSGGVSPLCSYSTLSKPLSIAFKAKSFLSDSLILLINPD